MQYVTVYTDGSFGDNGEVHGGVVYWGVDEPSGMVHVKATKPEFVSMRNIGGEVLAAWAAIMSYANNVKQLNEQCMDTYTLNLVYDYKGIGEWLTGRWKTNKDATRWFVKSVKEILKDVPNLKINFIWVKGHADTLGNHYADLVAGYDEQYAKNNNIPICNLDELFK